jgi:competence protein ComEA
MKIFKSLLFVSLLCLFPATVTFAQSSEVLQEMPQFEPVSINNADLNMLAKLPGIGKKKAQAIIDYREENGEFTNVGDLAQVKGVGKKLMAKLEGKIKL